MSISKRPYGYLILLLSLLLSSLGSVYAQGPGGTDESDTIVAEPSGQLTLTFEQLGYDTTRHNRDRSERFYRIDLPGNFQISPTGNYIDLVTYHLPDVPDKPAVLNSLLNGRPLAAISMTEANAISNTIRIDLPNGVLQPGTNSIRVNLDTSGTCQDSGALLDVYIDKSSTISFGYQQNSYPTDLALYPYPFVGRNIFDIPVTLVLPDQPSLIDLSAASTIMAGLGRMSGGAVNAHTMVAGELTDEVRNNHHLIVIGNPASQVLYASLDLPQPISAESIEAGQGVLEEVVSPWNPYRLVLVVSGIDDAGLLKASQALNREAHFLGVSGPLAIVTDIVDISDTNELAAPSITLASLGYSDQVIYGASPQDFAYDFQLPLGWQLDQAAFFKIKFTHSKVLDPLESVMDLRLNDVPIGGTLLDRSNIEAGELTIPLPTRLLRAGNNRLRLGVEMNFAGANRVKCLDLNNDLAWTVISSESEVFLPVNTAEVRPDLSQFPYPFSKVDRFDQTLFVLPDQPSLSVYNYLAQLVLRLGSLNQTETFAARVAFASDVEESMLENYHLIVLGLPSQNTLLTKINKDLPQPFTPDTNLLAPLAVDTVAFLPDENRDAGLLELISSPWNAEYSLLAISGTTEEGVRLALQTLLEPARPLNGNLAVVEPNLAAVAGASENLVRTYSIDTRPVTLVSASGDGVKDTSKKHLALLAERWWR